jgi:hypothetical protein
VQSHSFIAFIWVFYLFSFVVAEVTVLSSSKSSMEPKITSEGKFMCEDDGMTYNTREDFDKHCMKAHLKEGSENKNW